jgi:hypothetical protein
MKIRMGLFLPLRRRAVTKTAVATRSARRPTEPSFSPTRHRTQRGAVSNPQSVPAITRRGSPITRNPFDSVGHDLGMFDEIGERVDDSSDEDLISRRSSITSLH